MALGDFDSGQSSFEYGQSLLADKEMRDKKTRKRQKKIKNVSYLLGAVGVADMFLANKANKKVELWKESKSGDKAHELNNLSKANLFYNNQLQDLLAKNPSINFEDSNVWKKGGNLWSALEKISAAEAKALANPGRAIGEQGEYKEFNEEQYKKYLAETERLTSNAMKNLKAQYTKHKGYLGTTEKQIEARYKEIIDHGVRDLLSAKNTSSIRKILGKLGIADEMDANLELYKNAPESVGKIYINKKIQQDFADRMLDNGRRYKQELAVLGLDPKKYAYGEFPKGGIDYEKIPFEPAKTSRKRKSLVEIEPEIDTLAQDTFGQTDVDGNYIGASGDNVYFGNYKAKGVRGTNPALDRFNSIEIDGETPFMNFPDLRKGVASTLEKEQELQDLYTLGDFWDELYTQHVDKADGYNSQLDFWNRGKEYANDIYLKDNEILATANPDTYTKPEPTQEQLARGFLRAMEDVRYDTETGIYSMIPRSASESSVKSMSLETKNEDLDSGEVIASKSGKKIKFSDVTKMLNSTEFTDSKKIELVANLREDFFDNPEALEMLDDIVNQYTEEYIKEFPLGTFGYEYAMLLNKASVAKHKKEIKKEKTEIKKEQEDDTELYQTNQASLLEKYPHLKDI